MKVFLIREKKHAEYNDGYAMRLFEQNRAVPAATLKGENAKYWLNKLKTGMEEQIEAEAQAEAPAQKPPKQGKRTKGSDA